MAAHVAIVDDEENIRTILSDSLVAAGFEVCGFEGAEPALASLEENKPDVMVADLRMPGMNGLEMVREVRRLSPDTQVVILTGYGDMKSAVEALRLGAYDYLSKPVDIDRLTQSIRNAAERRALVLANRTLLRSLEEANRLKAEFIRGMNHEVRTPLGHILGFAQILEETLQDLNDKQLRYFENIRAGANGLLEMFENILQFSALQSGDARVKREPFSVSMLIDDVLESYVEAGKEKRLRLEREADADMVAEADLEMCRKILALLLDNAVKFTPEDGHVLVRADIRPEPALDGGRDIPDDGVKAAGWLHMAVVDTGEGIDPEDHERIFNLFEQVDGALNRQHQGSGLGLALALSLARGQGGTITVDSRPGAGSTFTAIIPLAAS